MGLLLEILPRKCPDWALLLFELLQQEKEHQGHVYLVELLKKSSKERSLDSEVKLANIPRPGYVRLCQSPGMKIPSD